MLKLRKYNATERNETKHDATEMQQPWLYTIRRATRPRIFHAMYSNVHAFFLYFTIPFADLRAAFLSFFFLFFFFFFSFYFFRIQIKLPVKLDILKTFQSFGDYDPLSRSSKLQTLEPSVRFCYLKLNCTVTNNRPKLSRGK